MRKRARAFSRIYLASNSTALIMACSKISQMVQQAWASTPIWVSVVFTVH